MLPSAPATSHNYSSPTTICVTMEEQQWQGFPADNDSPVTSWQSPQAKPRMDTLCFMGPALIMWEQNWTQSHWCSNYCGDRATEQRGAQATAKDAALARRDQLCRLICFSSHVPLYSHIALTHPSHVNPHLNNCSFSSAILVQPGYYGTCWLVDTWPLCSSGQQKQIDTLWKGNRFTSN